MQTFNTEQKDLDIEFYGSFISLWRVDDPEWVANRQMAWSTVYEDTDNPHIMFHGKFYIYGDEPPGYIGKWGNWDHPVQFDFRHRVALMPFEKAEQIIEFWQAVLRRYQRGHGRYHGDFLDVGNTLDGFPERDDMVKLITETMFTDEYFMRPLNTESASGGGLETIDPADFVVSYSNVPFFYQESNKNKWDYRNFSFDYFMQSIRFCEEANQRVAFISEKKLPDMYKYLLNLDDSKLTQYRAELKHQLIAAAEDQHAPGLLRDSYASAQLD